MPSLDSGYIPKIVVQPKRPSLDAGYQHFILACGLGCTLICRMSRVPLHQDDMSMKNISRKTPILYSEKVQIGKDQEKAQSEKDPHSKNQGGKKPN